MFPEDIEESPLTRRMWKEGWPMTREVYLELAFPEGVPAPLHPELEAEIPEGLE